MMHQKKGRKLGVKPAHRKALLRNMAVSLIKYKRIKTTDSRAKELRTFIEPLVTKAKKGDFNSIRQIMKRLPRKEAVRMLVHEIAPVFTDRPGGYTRLVKLGFRDNDRASISLIEFIDMVGPDNVSKNDTEKPDGKKKGQKKKEGKKSDKSV